MEESYRGPHKPLMWVLESKSLPVGCVADPLILDGDNHGNQHGPAVPLELHEKETLHFSTSIKGRDGSHLFVNSWLKLRKGSGNVKA